MREQKSKGKNGGRRVWSATGQRFTYVDILPGSHVTDRGPDGAGGFPIHYVVAVPANMTSLRC